MTTPLTRELLVIIPAWNEEKTLPGVLAEIRAALPEADVIVVDDGSQDSTSRVAANAGVNVLTLPINLGVGGAMRAGYVYAAREGYRQAVQVDASGALVHFVTQGQDHGYNPSRAFKVSWYLSRYPEVRKAGTNALSDYLTEGALRGRDPHPDFDTSWYTLMYPDSLSADLTPLAHYLTVGQFDGRATNAAGAHLAQH